MKKDGYAESTIKSTSKRLRMMNKHNVNLDNPDSVKEYLASKESSNGYKEVICDAYARYVKYNGLEWTRPRYQRDDQPPYVPTEEEVEILIANSGPKYALLLSLIRDTGMRPIEVERATVKWFDLERGSVNVQTAKHGRGRTLELKPRTLAMLKAFIARRRLSLNDRIFGKVKTMRGVLKEIKERTAHKLQRPELLRISLYSLRHYFATMTYHRTKDILYTQQKMGHRNLKNTLIYTHLVNFKSDEYSAKVAETVQEACKLIEAGFEYVTTIDKIKLFRKRK
ncbi:MAG: tyrosine-type recombinase/integrase [Candidatus Bathyarchaeota archaeon]|nr:MAG: tyrosine-type recombinase/integrase [Candidatus Bathyarchaeota archaeon]